jgi:parallel beta-helix repeat protein
MGCPGCHNFFGRLNFHRKTDRPAAENHTETFLPKKCVFCGSGLVRKVTRLAGNNPVNVLEAASGDPAYVVNGGTDADINAALNKAQNGDTVQLSGSFAIGGSVVMQGKTNVTLTGAGPSWTSADLNADGWGTGHNVLIMDGCTNCTIQNLTLHDCGNQSNGIQCQGYSGQGCVNCKIINCHVYNIGANGIDLGDSDSGHPSSGCVCQSCLVEGCGDVHIDICGDSEQIIGCTVQNCGSGPYTGYVNTHWAIAMESIASNCLVQNNTVNGGGVAQYCFSFRLGLTGGTGPTTNNTINNNWFYGSQYACIGIWDSSGNRISNNTCTGNIGILIGLGEASNDNTCTGNNLSGCLTQFQVLNGSGNTNTTGSGATGGEGTTPPSGITITIQSGAEGTTTPAPGTYSF